jgi:lysophospholipid acyltransferase (LPLAT)-like uncharacterized protein
VSDGKNLFVALRDRGVSENRLYLLWIADHLNLLAVAFADAQFLNASRQLRYVVDDSIGGSIVSRALRSVGIEEVRISEADPVSRLRSLRAMVQPGAPLVLAVDGRGPYYQVSSGVVSLARTLGMSMFPCAAIASHAITFPNRRVPVTLPRRGATISVLFGHAIHPQLDAKSTAAHIRDCLNTLRQTQP